MTNTDDISHFFYYLHIIITKSCSIYGYENNIWGVKNEYFN